MRHRISKKIIGRTADARQALAVGLVRDFFRHGFLQTYLAKAKYIKPILEKTISLGRRSSLTNRRRLLTVLGDARLVNKLCQEFGAHPSGRSSGQIRIVKLGQRRGDAAPIASLELVDHQAHD